MNDETETIEAGSGCSASGTPFVELHWHDKGAQISPQNARDLAQSLLEAAASAEGDAMLLRFFRKLDLPDGAWQAMVVEWREWKEKQGQNLEQ